MMDDPGEAEYGRASRRRLLAAGGIALLAGCSGPGAGGEDGDGEEGGGGEEGEEGEEGEGGEGGEEEDRLRPADPGRDGA